jgi:pyruvate formate lyase activating enzyme
VLDEQRSGTYCPGCNALLLQRQGLLTVVKDFKNGKCAKCGEKIAGVWE